MGRRRFWSVFFAAAGLIVLYCLLQKLSVVATGVKWVFGIFSPILVGFMIAFVLKYSYNGQKTAPKTISRFRGCYFIRFNI